MLWYLREIFSACQEVFLKFHVIIETMKPLIETNPYLINKEHREASNARSVKTSCGVEGITIKPFSMTQVRLDSSKTQLVLNKIKARLNSV